MDGRLAQPGLGSGLQRLLGLHRGSVLDYNYHYKIGTFKSFFFLNSQQSKVLLEYMIYKEKNVSRCHLRLAKKKFNHNPLGFAVPKSSSYLPTLNLRYSDFLKLVREKC